MRGRPSWIDSEACCVCVCVECRVVSENVSHTRVGCVARRRDLCEGRAECIGARSRGRRTPSDTQRDGIDSDIETEGRWRRCRFGSSWKPLCNTVVAPEFAMPVLCAAMIGISDSGVFQGLRGAWCGTSMKSMYGAMAGVSRMSRLYTVSRHSIDCARDGGTTSGLASCRRTHNSVAHLERYNK